MTVTSSMVLHAILTGDLGMHRKFVPSLLLCEQQEMCLDSMQDLLECVCSDTDLLKTVLTGGESWVFGQTPRLIVIVEVFWSSLWCSSVQETGVVEVKQVTAASRQCPGPV